MQEEATQKTIALVFKPYKLSASVLQKAMKMYLEHHKHKQQKVHGKISVKELVGQGMGALVLVYNYGHEKLNNL